MKKIALLLLLAATMLSASGLKWEKDVPTAIAKAKAEKKNIMLMVEATYCKWCKRMKRETLSDPRVQERLKRYILVKIRRCDKEAMKVLPKARYAAPTIFFMTPGLQTLDRVIGYFDADDFLTYFDDIE